MYGKILMFLQAACRSAAGGFFSDEGSRLESRMPNMFRKEMDIPKWRMGRRMIKHRILGCNILRQSHFECFFQEHVIFLKRSVFSQHPVEQQHLTTQSAQVVGARNPCFQRMVPRMSCQDGMQKLLLQIWRCRRRLGQQQGLRLRPHTQV